MKRKTPNVYLAAIEKYRKEAIEAKEKGNKQAYKDAKWKIKYFKNKIREKKALKND